jgi:lysophospholipase
MTSGIGGSCEPAFAPQAPSFGWLDAGMRSGRVFTRRNLAKVQVPVLLLAAVQDKLVSLEAIRRVAEQLPRAELELYDGCAHEILRETDETRLPALARIDAFLDEHAR